MDVVVTTSIGWLVLLLANGSLAYAAHLLVRRFFDRPPAVRWALMGVIAVAWVLTITQALAAVSFYDRTGVIASVLVASVCHWSWGASRNITAEIQPLRAWLAAVLASRGALLLCAAMLSLLLALARGLSSPPLEWDSLTYHLFLAARFVQLHTLAGFNGPPMMDHYIHFPRNGEIMAAWLLLPFGSDLIVSLVGFFFLSLGAVSVYALSREVGGEWEDASLTACLVCFSPFLFAYVTTQGVDIQAFAAILSGTLFALRYVRHRHGGEAIAAFVAIGIALGTKHTALVLGVMSLAPLTAVIVLHHRLQRDWPAAATIIAAGVLLATIAGARSYVDNWRQTGNPIYPLEVSVAGRQLLRGSSYTAMIAEKNEDWGSRHDDLIQLESVFNYYPTWRLPTSAGPKFPLLLVLALGSLVADTRPRWPACVLGTYGALGVLAFYLPSGGLPALARHVWPGASARFLVAPFSLLAVSAVPTLTRLRRRYPAVIGVFATFALWDMLVANNSVAASFPLGIGLSVAAFLPAILFIQGRGLLSPRSLAPLLTAAAIASLVILCGLQVIRDGNRWIRYMDTTDVSWIPRDFVAGWRECDRPEQPLRIALTTGWEYRGQNWFFYPLMGRRLQNTVVYVPTELSASSARDGTPSGSSNEHAARAWTASLRYQGVDRVFVQKPWPIEDTWMDAQPDVFTLLKTGKGFKTYAVAAR